MKGLPLGDFCDRADLPGNTSVSLMKISSRLSASSLRWGLQGITVAVLLFLMGCRASPPPIEQLEFIKPDQHRIEQPSQTNGRATGTACADNKKDAYRSARETAKFNLRTLTGSANYLVDFEILSLEHRQGMICLEVLAKAIATRRSRQRGA